MNWFKVRRGIMDGLVKRQDDLGMIDTSDIDRAMVRAIHQLWAAEFQYDGTIVPQHELDAKWMSIKWQRKYE